MNLRITGLALASLFGVSAAIGVSAPAQASTTEYACPISAGIAGTAFDSYDPAIVAANPITDLVGCTTAYTPPRSGVPQTLKDAFMYFGPLPASVFDGNDLSLRVVGTPDNGGFLVSMWVNKDTAQNAWNSPDYVVRQLVMAGPGGAGTSSDVEKTETFTVTVSDPTVRAKILAGDFVVVAAVIGGLGAGTESVRSVSLAYTSFSVTFDSNGGSGTMPDATGAEPGDLPANTLTRSGYTFAGWNDDRNGNGNAYADGDEFEFSGDTTLYAQWTQDTQLADTGIDTNLTTLVAGALGALGLSIVLVSVRRRRLS
jgi:uncharacterized repeat protein (TIGR02543 family)/LPXTG-motif cell wall-anchored protein